jgi:hypothetical protein
MYWIIEAFLNLFYSIGMTAVGLCFMVVTAYFVGMFGGSAYEIADEYRTGRYQNGDATVLAAILGAVWALFVCLNAPSIGAMFVPCLVPCALAVVAHIVCYVMLPIPARPASEFD